MRRIAIIVGTRPEIIKCAPVLDALRASPRLDPYLLCTGQHLTMAEQALHSFGHEPDCNLKLMNSGQTPLSFLSGMLDPLREALQASRAGGVVVQGDTTTALGGALTAFHLRLPVAHLEAGLRTEDPAVPFPEEMNRRLISTLASIHLCPTVGAEAQLRSEGITKNTYVVGNTVVDALHSINRRLDSGEITVAPEIDRFLAAPEPFILVTGHRREHLDGPLSSLCSVLTRAVTELPAHRIIYPVHRNPRVRDTVHAALTGHPRITLTDTLDYPSFIALLRRASLVVTDSGGIQEEAPTFGTPVIVTRAATERPEAVECGVSEVIPLAEPELLLRRIVERVRTQGSRTEGQNPFGDGHAAERIVEILAGHWGADPA